MSPATRLFAALGPQPLPTSRADRFATVVLFAVGATGALCFLQSFANWMAVGIAVCVATALLVAQAQIDSPRRTVRVLARIGFVPFALLHVLWAYLSVAWGGPLAWSVSPLVRVALVMLVLAAVATRMPKWRRGRIPLALPAGLWIALCLTGWLREEAFVHCDDYLDAVRDPSVRVIAPVVPTLDRCTAGATLWIARYPRVVWQAPDGNRLVVTTQSANGRALGTSRFDGSVCETTPGAASAVTCFVRQGKAQGFAESPTLDRLLIASWAHFAPGVRGRLLAFTRSEPLRLVASVDSAYSVGELVYDPTADRIHAFPDEGGVMVPVRASTMTAEPLIRLAVNAPGAVRYDADRHEGIVCTPGFSVPAIPGGQRMAIAVRGNPTLSMRALGNDGLMPWVSTSWGCDFDPVRRLAFVAVPNLGVLTTIDYDTGRILARSFLGFGIRSLTFDPRRRILYVTHFLRGELLAVDAATGRELRRWRVGRFVRFATISRDGDEVLVGSTLGVVSIRVAGLRAN